MGSLDIAQQTTLENVLALVEEAKTTAAAAKTAAEAAKSAAGGANPHLSTKGATGFSISISKSMISELCNLTGKGEIIICGGGSSKSDNVSFTAVVDGVSFTFDSERSTASGNLYKIPPVKFNKSLKITAKNNDSNYSAPIEAQVFFY